MSSYLFNEFHYFQVLGGRGIAARARSQSDLSRCAALAQVVRGECARDVFYSVRPHSSVWSEL